jgi:hypothetical protein
MGTGRRSALPAWRMERNRKKHSALSIQPLRKLPTADFTDHADSKGKILHIDGPEIRNGHPTGFNRNLTCFIEI